jgi:hypothetical protein
MKKVIVILIMSLIFLATYAQRPSKSRSNEVTNTDRKKSEMTTERSDNNASRSVINNNKTTSPRSTDDRSGYDNNHRNVTPVNKDNRHDDDPPVNANRNRSITDKINENKTDLHKNVEIGRGNSINSRTYEVERRNYSTPPRKRIHREVNTVQRPKPIEYRKIHYPYRAPVNIHVIWSPRMYHEYRWIYPEYRYWYYPTGYRISTISAYNAIYYTGEIVNVYGRVYEAFHCRETDEYFLYFGARYPYHDFSVVIQGNKARQFSRRPEIFFEGRYIWVTGLISLHHGQPEMIVRKKHQIHLY